MGVFKRYKEAQAAQKDAENAVPGAYQSNYTDRINQTLDDMSAAANAGVDVGTDSELYRQYRGNAQANAQAAAENAAAGAAALSGGYGSSYANSVAQQGYQQAMANVDDGLAGLREKALSQYQLKQSGLAGILSALMSQDSLEAAEHQGAVANAQDWRDYKKSRADQAAQEKSDWISNLWQLAKSVGQAGLTAYDRYKGYDQWQKEFETGLYNQAFDLYKEGATGAANSLLSRYGLDSTIFDDYTGGPMTWKEELELTDQMLALKDKGADLLAYRFADKYGLNRDALENYTGGGLTTKDKLGYFINAASLAGDGNQTAADNVLTQFLNLPAGSAGNYSDISKNLISTALAKKSGSGSSGSRSSSSGSKSGGWTNSQLQSMAKTFSSMKGNEPLYDFYKQTLTDNGWLQADTTSGGQNTGGAKSGTATQNITAPHIPTTGSTMKQGQARSLAVDWKKQGYSDDDIIDKLMQRGYSDEEIYGALKLN